MAHYHAIIVALLILSGVAGGLDIEFQGGSTNYTLIICNNLSVPVDGIIVGVEVPAGITYKQGSSCILFEERSVSNEPEVDEDRLEWDLSNVLCSRKHIVINEFDPNPVGIDSNFEWVELYNPTTASIDASGWTIRNADGDILIIRQGTILQPKGYCVIYFKGYWLDNKGEGLELYNGDILVDKTPIVDDSNESASWARYPNGLDTDSDSDWIQKTITGGSPNGGIFGDLLPGRSASIKFEVLIGCGAQSGQRLQCEVSGTSDCHLTEYAISPPLIVQKGSLRITMPEYLECEIGEVVTWEAVVDNQGLGSAHLAQIDLTMGHGLSLISLSSNGGTKSGPSGWTYHEIGPGESRTIYVTARVVSLHGINCTASGRCSCPGSCEEAAAEVIMKPGPGFWMSPDELKEVPVGGRAGYTILAYLPGGSFHNLQINATLAAGLLYESETMSFKSAAIDPAKIRVDATDDGTTPVHVCWRIGDVHSTESLELQMDFEAIVANVISNQQGVSLVSSAEICWEDDSGRSWRYEDASGPIDIVEPDLSLHMEGSRKSGDMGDNLTITLEIAHSGLSRAFAFDADLEVYLPDGMTYIEGSGKILSGPVPHDFIAGSERLIWRFGTVDLSHISTESIRVAYNVTVAQAFPGEEIVSSSKLVWSSAPGNVDGERDGKGGEDDYFKTASYTLTATRLSISVHSTAQAVSEGETLGYIIKYENIGGIDAHDVHITGELSPELQLIFSSPKPCESLLWGTSCGIPDPLRPDGPHYIELSVKAAMALANGTALDSVFTLDSIDTSPLKAEIRTYVLNESRLEVNKTANKKTASRGDTVGYMIKVCNRGGTPATSLTVRDTFSSHVDLVSSSPPPGPDGLWHIDLLAPGGCVEIFVVAEVPKTEILFLMDNTVRGNGFANIKSSFDTSADVFTLTNTVQVTSNEGALASDFAVVTVTGEPGTSLHERGHGSGTIQRTDFLRYLTKNRTIDHQRSVSAVFEPMEMELHKNRKVGISSPWSFRELGWSYESRCRTLELYRRASSINSSSSIVMDENGTLMEISSEFNGSAEVEFLKKHVNEDRPSILDLDEEYDGRFSIYERADGYGASVEMDGSCEGSGFISRDRRIGDSQRSYESGSGSYDGEESIRTHTSYVSKQVNVSCIDANRLQTDNPPLRRSAGWRLGVVSRNGDESLLKAEFSQAQNLSAGIVSRGLNQQEVTARFSGNADLHAALKGHLDTDQEFSGRYSINSNVLFARAARYARPHITISNEGKVFEGRLRGENVTFARYLIAVANDGNCATGPVAVQDVFPEGTGYLNSSIRPSKLQEDYANWTLDNLGIGEVAWIELLLTAGYHETLINRVNADAQHAHGLISASNYTVIKADHLSCKGPDIEAFMDGRTDTSSSSIIRYNITVCNHADSPISVSIIDELPDGVAYRGSSKSPSSLKLDRIVWNLAQIDPGKQETLELFVEALWEGWFFNQAYIEAFDTSGGERSLSFASAQVIVDALDEPDGCREIEEEGDESLDVFFFP